MKTISKQGFEKWMKNMIDANVEVCMKWFGDGKTFDECFDFLRKEFTTDEIAHAFMR